MAENQLWDTFQKTGYIEDYLVYKGISIKKSDHGQYQNKSVGENAFESVNNGDRNDTFGGAYRGV